MVGELHAKWMILSEGNSEDERKKGAVLSAGITEGAFGVTLHAKGSHANVSN